MLNIRRGDIVFVDLPVVKGSIQGGCRPCVVVQNDMGNTFSPLCLVAPITSSSTKKRLPTHVEYEHLDSKAMSVRNTVLCEQIFTVLKTDIDSSRSKNLRMTEETMRKIDEALKISLGLK